MKSLAQFLGARRGGGFAIVAMLLAGGLIGSCGETKDNFDSQIVCGDYCTKKFDCDGVNPTGDQSSSCVAACRNSIEDNCGNDHQAAANDKIGECVDKNCVDFWACMVFDAAPDCYGFVNQ